MRILRYSLVLLALCHTTQSWAKSASDFFPICSALGSAPGKTLTVDPSSRTPGALPTIDAALKAARPRDVISLMSGDYGDLKIYKNLYQELSLAIDGVDGLWLQQQWPL
jgi:hypothetical protein